jgi:transcriptional regulator with XRE-family HTH domain
MSEEFHKIPRRRRAGEPQPDGAQIGGQIRELRKAKGMTLQALSDASGLSIGYLSQLERGRSTLTIGNLKLLADQLGVHMNWFFLPAPEPSAEELGVVVRKNRRRRLSFTNLGIEEELLSPNLAGPLELLLSTLEPGADSGDYSHEGAEAGLVIQGELELWVGGACFRLETGDSFSFRSTEVHRCRNPGTDRTQVVWVITPPSY